MATQQRYEYREAQGLTRWTRRMIWMATGVALAAVAFDITEVHRLNQPDAVMMTEEFTGADALQALVAFLQVISAIVVGFLILRWIHRMNWNARARGAQGMTITPGWAVGWYFVPIANLVKPQESMKEIWQASANPAQWQSVEPPKLIGTWWTLWLLVSILGNIGGRLMFNADDVGDLLVANGVMLFCDVASLPLNMVFLDLMAQLTALQSGPPALPTVDAEVVA